MCLDLGYSRGNTIANAFTGAGKSYVIGPTSGSNGTYGSLKLGFVSNDTRWPDPSAAQSSILANYLNALNDFLSGAASGSLALTGMVVTSLVPDVPTGAACDLFTIQ